MDEEPAGPLLLLFVLVVVVVVFVLVGLGFDQINCWLDGATWAEGRCLR